MTNKTILHYEDAMRRILSLPYNTNVEARAIAMAAMSEENETTPLLPTDEMVAVLGDIICGGGRATKFQQRLIMRYVGAVMAPKASP